MKLVLRIAVAFLGFFFSAQQVSAQSYCVPSQIGFNGCWAGEDINSVTIGTFSDLNTGCGNPRYQDRTSVGTIPLTVGANTSFTITSTSGLGLFYGIWIDANGDGDFNDPNEFVWSGLTAGVSSGSFVVPSGAGSRRLRILAMSKSSPLVLADQCAASFWGEMQDYTCLINSAGCPVASALTAHTVRDTSATLAWTGTGTKYRIEYGQTGFTQGAGTLDSSTTNFKMIGGLTAVTTYDYYVKNICSAANQSGWNGPYTFTTLCEEIAVYPYVQNFDSVPWVGTTGNAYNADAISTCWSRFPTYNFNYAWTTRTAATTNPNTGPSSDASGNGNYMQTSSIGTTPSVLQTAFLNTPAFNLGSLTSPILEFKYHMYGATMGKLFVESSTDGGQTWITLDSLVGQQQISKTSGWLTRTIDLTSSKSSLTYLRFRSTSYGNYGDLAIDELRVEEAPQCPAPSAPSITNLLGNGATINWTSNNSVFHIEYGLSGFTQGTGNIDTVNTNSFVMSNLLSETFYDVYVRTDCNAASNGNSGWLGPITLRTHTLPPFEENFTGGFIPDNRWAKLFGTLANPTVFNNNSNSQWTVDGFANVGTTGAVRISCFISSTRSDWFTTKSIDLGTSSTNWELYFDIALTGNGNTSSSVMGSDDVLKVIISTDNGATWSSANTIMTIDASSNLSNIATELTQSLSGYSGVVKFGFYFESTTNSPNSFDIFIDNLGVREPGVCPQPNTLSASNITATSLTLNWNGYASVNSYTVEYGPTGFVQGTGTFVNGVVGNSTGITGLSPVTLYDFYFRSNCDTGTTSLWTSPLTVLTGCPQFFTTPYFTDFETNTPGTSGPGGKMNNCWIANPASTSLFWRTGLSGQTINKASGPDFDNTYQTVGTGKYVYVSATAGPDATLTGGPFDLSNLNEPTMEFFYHMFGSGMGTLHVDVSLDEVNWISDIAIIKGEQQSNGSDNWLKAVAPLSQFVNDTVYIRLRAEYGTSYLGDMAVDDFRIFEANGCQPPNSLSATAISTTGATLNWATYEPNTSIEYGLTGFIAGTGTGTVVHNASPGTMITGLTPNTTYDFYVKDTCDLGAQPAWIGPYTFKTECLGALSGIYTIGGPVGSTNFGTLDSAVTRLNECGVSGPVVFNLTGGKHVGQFDIGDVPGSSAINTIAFNGTVGLDTIMAATVDHVLRLNGTSFITFNGITFINDYGYTVIWLTNNAHHLTIENSQIIGQPSVGSSTYSLISASYTNTNPNTQGHNAHHVTIRNNWLSGNYVGISITGVDGDPNTSLSIADNTFLGVSSTAIRVAFMDSVEISGNNMSGNGGYGYGINLQKTSNTVISKNTMNISGRGIYINQNDTSGTLNIVNNSIIASTEGIYLSQAGNANVYHNSVNSNNYGLYCNGTLLNADIRNNILIANVNHAFYSAIAPTTSTIDYNIYESNGGYLATVGGTNYVDLAAWKTASSMYNTNSLQGDPLFYSAIDLQTTGTLANNVGDNTVGVAEDINGNLRPASGATVVDIGAFEYTPKLTDAELFSIYEPSSACGSATTNVSVVVKNWGLNTITSMPIRVEVSGGITSTLNFTYTGSLANRDVDTVSIGSINTANITTPVTIEAFTMLSNDEDSSNDTIVKTFNFIPATPQYLMLDSICPNATSGVINALPIPGVTYSWYNSLTTPTATDTGSVFNFNPAVQTTWYLGYGYNGSDFLNTSFSTSYGYSGGIMFYLEAKHNIVIDSLDINITYASNSQAPVSIYYMVDQPIQGNEVNAPNWTLHESSIVVSNGPTQPTRFVFSTPLEIPYGAKYAIYVYAPTALLNVSPITPHVYNSKFMEVSPGSGLQSLFSTPTSGRQFSGTIFASEFICDSTRTMIEVPTTSDTAVASFTTIVSQPNKVDVDASASQGDLVTWNFGDGGTATGKVAVHVYTTGGPYTITCIVEDTVCNTFDTAYFAVNMTIGINENELTRSINIFPNPSTGIFNLAFDLSSREEVSLRVVDALGRTVFAESFTSEGAVSRQIDLSNQARGLYFVHITAGNNTVVKKITKM